MRVNAMMLLVAATAVGGGGLFAQTPASLSDVTEPNPADFEVAAEEVPPAFAQIPAVAPQPAAPELGQQSAPELSPEAQQYRAVIEALSQNKHQFVHCKLKNGKIFTGLLRDVGDAGFTVKADALSGPYVTYESLAEQPRVVLAVGTRVKQGAEWAGIGAVVALAIPIIIVLSPLLFASGWRC